MIIASAFHYSFHSLHTKINRKSFTRKENEESTKFAQINKIVQVMPLF